MSLEAELAVVKRERDHFAKLYGETAQKLANLRLACCSRGLGEIGDDCEVKFFDDDVKLSNVAPLPDWIHPPLAENERCPSP